MFPRKLNRKVKALIGVGITVFVVLYLELFSYVLKTSEWSRFPDNPVTSGQSQDSIKVLFVADPQIQGVLDEPAFLGVFTRWDADRYLQKTYVLARQFVQPDVVVFLGDLFDEGSKATESQWHDYFERFSNIFLLPKRKDPSDIKYIFLPGDNDVGGEGYEDVSQEKLDWFNKTFGDFSRTDKLQIPPVDVHFYKYNFMLPRQKNSFVVPTGDDKALRLLLSHTWLLGYITESGQHALDAARPHLAVTAHTHKSAFMKLEYSAKNTVHSTIIKNFLLENTYTTSSKSGSVPDNTEVPPPQDIRFRLDLSKNGNRHTVYEIAVPTCSYRMGVPNMGYGYMQLFEDGTVDYTVLWLPSRFHQLYAYLTVYIISKIVLTPWVLYRLIRYALTFRKTKYHQINVHAS